MRNRSNLSVMGVLSFGVLAAAFPARAATLSLDIDPPKVTETLPKNTTTQTSSTSEYKTTYSNSGAVLTGLDLTESGATISKTTGDGKHKKTVYTTTVTGNESESYSYDQSTTVTDYTRTKEKHGDGYSSWKQSGSPTVTDSILNGLGTGSDTGSFSGQAGTVVTDYDFSLGTGHGINVTLVDSTLIGGLTVSLESYGTVLESWVSNGVSLLPTALANFAGDSNSDDKYHLVVTATGFGGGSYYDINVSGVPLPAALPMFAAGLMGLGALGWAGRHRKSV